MRILIAVDFGLYGKAQIELLRKFVDDQGTHVKILHVIEPICWELQTGYPSSMPLSESIITECREVASQLVANIATEIKTFLNAAVIETCVREGSIANEILAEAEEFGSRLIIVGSHGRTGIARLLMGSVSQAAAAHAKCSVVIARIDEAEAR